MARTKDSGTARPTTLALPCGLMFAAMAGAINAIETPIASHTLRLRRSFSGCTSPPDSAVPTVGAFDVCMKFLRVDDEPGCSSVLPAVWS